MVISGFIDINCRTACYKSGFKWQIHLWGSTLLGQWNSSRVHSWSSVHL